MLSDALFDVFFETRTKHPLISVQMHMYLIQKFHGYVADFFKKRVPVTQRKNIFVRFKRKNP